MTASERRAAGEEPQCDCSGCVSNAREDARRVAAGGEPFTSHGEPRLGMLFRAHVLWSFLFGWGEP